MARKYLAPIAEKNSCKVISFDTALEAGEFLKTHQKITHGLALRSSSDHSAEKISILGQLGNFP